MAISRFAFWNPGTWQIPKLYWDAFSDEQRIHAICKQLGKVIAYADYLGINVEDIADRLKAIEEGELDPYIFAKIEEWFEEHHPQIEEALAALNDALPIEEFDAEHTVKDSLDGLASDISDINNLFPLQTASIDDAAVTTTKIADAAVTTAKIANGAVTPEKLSDDAVASQYIPASIDSVEVVFREEMKRPVQGLNGGCRFVRNGIPYYAWVYSIGYQDAYINVANEDGTIIIQRRVTNIGHGQNMTYNNGYLYITDTNYPQVELTGTGFAVYEVTDSDVVYTEKIIIPGIDVLFDATLDDDYYYARNGADILKIRRSDFVTVASTTLQDAGLTNAGQGFKVWSEMNALTVCVNGPNQIVMLSLDDLSPIASIDIAQSYGHVLMFEPEWYDFDGYTVYIGNFSNYTTPATNVNDSALFTVLKTDVYNQKGLSCKGTTRTNWQVDSQLFAINIDYANGSMYPTGETFKYTQDAVGYALTFGRGNEVEFVFLSDSPQMLVLGNFNGMVSVTDGAPGGIKFHGCNVSLIGTGSHIGDNFSNWARSPWGLAQDSTVYINVPMTNIPAGSNLMSAYRCVIVAATQAMLDRVISSNSYKVHW